MKKVSAIVLAAGAAQRYGGGKMDVFLPNGKRLLQHILDIVIASELEPIILVTGLKNNVPLLRNFNMSFQHIVNPDSSKGISSSLQTGIRNIPDTSDGCMVVLGDQPFISIELVNKLVAAYSVSTASIFYPEVDRKRTNPVILDRGTFSALKDLKGDVGARELFSQFESQAVDWHDRRLLLDLDTVEDYALIQNAWNFEPDNSDTIN